MYRPGQIATRFLIVVLLALAIWNPAFLSWHNKGINIGLLLDESASMSGSQRDDWARLRRWFSILPDDTTIDLIRFAAEPAIESESAPMAEWARRPEYPPLHSPLPRNGTDIAAAIASALRRTSDPAHGGALVLVSDLAETKGDMRAALQMARAADIPVYALMPPSARGPDGWIEDMHLPTELAAGSPFVFTVSVGANTDGAARLRLRIDEDPERVEQLRLIADGIVSRQFMHAFPRAGSHRIVAHLELEGDVRSGNDMSTRYVHVEGLPRIVYIGHNRHGTVVEWLRHRPNPLISLEPTTGNWGSWPSPPAGVVVLDDIAIDELPHGTWKDLLEDVDRHGTGLLVLGGEHSFGRGAYRGSELEQRLPLVSEWRRETATDILYLIDTSGSMARTNGRGRRLGLALTAIRTSIADLAPGDRIGIMTFATTTRELVPLGSPTDTVIDPGHDGPIVASGGTRLTQALTAAISRLGADEAGRRMLVIVSDGDFVPADLASAIRVLEASNDDILPLALIVGRTTSPGLRQAIESKGGRYLRIDRTIELPHIMRREIERVLDPVHRARSKVRIVRRLPFGGDMPRWPAVEAYAKTSARDPTYVHLQTAEGGAPLLAIDDNAGGRVAVLPAGLGSWASAWLEQAGTRSQLDRLIDWMGGASDHGLTIAQRTQGNTVEITVDALDDAGHWLDGQQARMSLTGPDGFVLTVPLAQTAPGRYAKRVRVPKEGHYSARIEIGARTRWFDFATSNRAEYRRTPASTYTDLIEQGLLRPLDRMTHDIGGHGRHSLRPMLLIVAIVLFLGLLILESPRIQGTWRRGSRDRQRRLS